MLKIHMVGGNIINSTIPFQELENLLGKLDEKGGKRLILNGTKTVTVFVDHIITIEEV